MSTATLVEQLRDLSNVDRLAVIEAATRLIREDMQSAADPVGEGEQRLRAAALSVRDLYEPGGDLTEWTALDGEEVLDDAVQG